MRTRARAAKSDDPVRRLEGVVSGVLRAGVILSSSVIASGVAVTLVRSPSLRAAKRSVRVLRRGVPLPPSLAGPHSVAGVVQGLAHGDGGAIVMLGLLLLIATPVVRVAVSVIVFSVERDSRYVLITLTVLAVLIGSFAVGA
jgi:uncharacterized membrane protein